MNEQQYNKKSKAHDAETDNNSLLADADVAIIGIGVVMNVGGLFWRPL